MIRSIVLIVEENVNEAAHLQRLLLSSGYDTVETSNDPDDAYRIYKEIRPGICVIDIFHNGKPDGITLANKITQEQDAVNVIFLTSVHDITTFYLAKATNPYCYLLKPYNPLELKYAIDLAFNKMQNTRIGESDILFIKRGNSIKKINVNEIKYIEVDGKYSRIVCLGESFLIQQPLKELQLQLPDTLFSRVHRNYIINMSEITNIDILNNEVILKSKKSLPLSRRYLDNIMCSFKVWK